MDLGQPAVLLRNDWIYKVRRMRAVSICGMALLVLASTAPARAPASTPAPFRTTSRKAPPPVPGGFRLKASNGYSLLALGVPALKGQSAKILLIVSGRHQAVTYLAPATVTETSIQANLGDLGEISVIFHPSGQPTKARSKCGGKPVAFDSGYYAGRIAFHGEEGYTKVEATSVPGNVDFLLNVLCPGIGGGRSPLLPGAELSVRNPQLGPEFTVVKNRPSAPARFEVSASEYRDGISIERDTALLMPAGSFQYDRRLQAATLHPPPPFAGTAKFNRAAKPNSRWSGDLTIDMPGRADVPLTGTGLRATLVHAEWDNGEK